MVPVFEDYKRKLFPYGSQDTLASITALGYVLFLFETGIKMDFCTIMRTGRKAWVIMFFGLVSPIIFGFATRNVKGMDAFSNSPLEGNIIMIGHNTTSFAVVVALLNDLKLLNSELGRLALSVSLIGDLLSNIFITISSTMVSSSDHISFGMRLGSLFGIAIFVLFIYRPAMFWVVEHTPEGKEVKDIYVNIVIGILFSLCWFSGYLERGPVFLPFIFGLATPEGPPLGSTLIKRIHLLGLKLFLPIFMTTSTMKVEYGFWNSSSTSTLDVFLYVLFLGYFVRMVACFICSLFFNMPPKDAITLSLLLNCKGVVQVTMYSTALDRNDILSHTHCVIILIIMVSICITHLLVKRLYDPSRKYAGYEKRNLFSLKHNSEWKILVVIHKQHHVTPITEVIDLCHPIAERPITVDALHLIELVGRSSPIFISHKKKKVVALNLHDSYSDNVVLNLKLYEHDKLGAAIINPYTAISPLNLMHEDVCHLAFDKLSSIIILPFHKKWFSDGKLEYEDKNIRSLNCSVLERSPCSVGILVTRGIRQTDSLFRLALVFLGGRDDREALCLANRAAQDPNVELVIYHIVDKKRTSEDMENLETRLDIAMLKDSKISHSGLGNVAYEVIEVEGGSQTIDVLRQMGEEHDFIIVGRRHGIKSPQTYGLQEWSEFPELGPVGDILASSDLDCKASVLVVQQQQQICM
ncbi:cation/H(+) antiporter 4-like [Trifolium pratense]|uniref:cation/H(+) antiporter 4-like n=1 Tax=Trifolium pratense TaxID=57577 RepID=UPI001E695A92|nr:cation/H(+) antiporter 4-like [Trifolium pratense]